MGFYPFSVTHAGVGFHASTQPTFLTSVWVKEMKGGQLMPFFFILGRYLTPPMSGGQGGEVRLI
ncbi:MAG: hypothetical protein EWV76_14245 [Microcystis novacekii Mn_MB_F_20050700_S1]|uniref:Uncharacterized protein n=1 Tax=Microcystis novacekii Mn_MB_F_20050700_S1D TaxID=2486266 RepID=A0A552IF97_9CHRO|nr:MAG: hypothetical protein EWV54_22380 [Microcystis novacekii Mn_MB_F_20050700_S1D]TRU85477.1 MAG: hypothetical protein EWV76_14245 [Microcystis novacekii Mn_MB_F_20050700_S1]